jgi:hypothetical protein
MACRLRKHKDNCPLLRVRVDGCVSWKSLSLSQCKVGVLSVPEVRCLLFVTTPEPKLLSNGCRRSSPLNKAAKAWSWPLIRASVARSLSTGTHCNFTAWASPCLVMQMHELIFVVIVTGSNGCWTMCNSSAIHRQVPRTLLICHPTTFLLSLRNVACLVCCHELYGSFLLMCSVTIEVALCNIM